MANGSTQLNRAGEFEVGHDPGFEARWWMVEKASWAVMLALLIAGVIGLFGRGPLAQHSVSAGTTEIRYERVLRYKTPTVITVNTTAAAAGGDLHVFVNRALLSRVQLERIVPQPIATFPRSDGALFLFRPSGPSAEITLVEQPGQVGVVRGAIAVEGGPAAMLRQFVVP
jgi:hypothetical protein